MKSLLILLPLLVACGGGNGGGGGNTDYEVIPMCLTDGVACGSTRTVEAVMHSWSSSYTLTATEFVLNDLLPERETQNCGLDPQPGKSYSYEIAGGQLVVDDSRVTVTFTRTENKNQLYGEWKFVKSSDRAMFSGSIEFTEGTVKIEGSCRK